MRESNIVTILGVALVLLALSNIIYVHTNYESDASTFDYFLEESEVRLESTDNQNDMPVTITTNDKIESLPQKIERVNEATESAPDIKESSISVETKEAPPTTQNNDNSATKSMVPISDGSDKVELLPKTTVAYAVSFIMCKDTRGTANAANLVDASLILRHSIHKISSRNPESGSKYDYKMFAFVHPQAEGCSNTLHDLGFEIILVDHPVTRDEMASEDQRLHIKNEFCCGEKEFIKLSAWTLPAELIVHLDIDFMFMKPMDHLFDAILYDKYSPEGTAAREKVMLELDTNYNATLPDKIGAFITRDWHQVAPNKWPPGYQAGYLVARRDPSARNEMIDIIRNGVYTQGYSNESGWGNKGYGGWMGARAMQGLVAYYYDHIRTGSAVNINGCRHNHMGADIMYRRDPFFRSDIPGVGGCRSMKETCEDCMLTDVDNIYSVHYTVCGKPWVCTTEGVSYMAKTRKSYRGKDYVINTDAVNVDHCMLLIEKWHAFRKELEDQLYSITKDESIKGLSAGNYKSDLFHGHCGGEGAANYTALSLTQETLSSVQKLYS